MLDSRSLTVKKERAKQKEGREEKGGVLGSSVLIPSFRSYLFFLFRLFPFDLIFLYSASLSLYH